MWLLATLALASHLLGGAHWLLQLGAGALLFWPVYTCVRVRERAAGHSGQPRAAFSKLHA